jgi:hypothetical protein
MTFSLKTPRLQYHDQGLSTQFLYGWVLTVEIILLEDAHTFFLSSYFAQHNLPNSADTATMAPPSLSLS